MIVTRISGYFNVLNEQDLGNITEAILKAHRQQLENDSSDPDLLYRYGILLMGVNRIIDASEAFMACLKINPTHYRAKSKLAICLLEMNQEKEALEQLDLPYKLSNETLELHYKLALLYCDKIKFASSIDKRHRIMNCGKGGDAK